jgi:hypothetical protein
MAEHFCTFIMLQQTCLVFCGPDKSKIASGLENEMQTYICPLRIRSAVWPPTLAL